MDTERLDERKAAILRAIVSHYVRSGEPAGSKTLVERFRLGVSPATVRNEMGALEEAGYLYQPHTSAGRIPTDLGYRFFVDSLATDLRLPPRDATIVRRFFDEPRWELQDALRETATLLSTLTDHAAIVFTPAMERSVVRRVELVRLSRERAMLLLVTDTGRVENHIIGISENMDDVQLDNTSEMLNRIVVDQPLDGVARLISDALDRFPLEIREAVAAVATALEEELSERVTERVFLEGAANIVDEAKFSDLETVRQVIGALEHRRVVLEVLAEAIPVHSVSVRIGAENPSEMQFCSVIAAPYGPDAPIGSLGIVGPTRMDYRRAIASVNEVATALGRMLSDLGL
jgi:heat-inducible transcriptional repressor